MSDDELTPVKQVAGTYARMPLLRTGSVGGAVVLLQELLGIKADGRFGAKTEKAVRAFQKRKRIAVDGEVGPDTWAALAE